MQNLPLSATIYWQIEEYICQNSNQYAGVSVAKVTMGHKFTAHQVNKTYGLKVDEFDVLATMRYMVEVDNLVSCGFFGSIETFRVNPDVKEG